MRTTHTRRIRRTGVLAAGLATALFAGLPHGAWGQGVSLTFSPAATWTEWDKELELERTALFGGAAQFGFGRFVSLTGYHARNSSVPLFANAEAPLFKVDQSGVRLAFALGTGSLVPLLSAGGSIHGFEPEGGTRIRRIGVDVGGGLRTQFGDVLTGELLVNRGLLRLEQDELLGGPFDQEAATRRNLMVTTAFGLRLGTRSLAGVSDLDKAFEERYRSPFANLALSVEPMAGRLNWADATGLPRQDMVGVRGGLDFGPFFGLRGFHFWGTEDDFRTRTEMKAWGGEAQFNFGADRPITPHLIGGVSQITWGTPDPASELPPRSDQTALVAGAGMDFNLGPWVRATVGVRDFILAGSDLTVAPGLEKTTDPASLVHNWQVSAGLKFVVSGRGVRRAAPVGRTPRPELVETARGTEKPTLPEGAPRGPDVLTVPVLERGEVVVRFGETATTMVTALPAAAAPAADPLVAAQLVGVLERLDRRLATLEGRPARDTLVAELPAAPAAAPAVPTADPSLELRSLMRVMEERLAALETGARPPVVQPAQPAAADPAVAALGRIEERLAALEVAGRRPVTTVAAPTTVVVETSGEARLARRLNEVRPYFAVGPATQSGADGPQFVFGAATNIGPLSPGSKLDLVPEVAFGFGSGGSIMVNTSIQYGLPRFRIKGTTEFQPIVGFGPALLKSDRFSARLTTFFGTGVRFTDKEGVEKANIFAAYQATDLFSEGRFMVGMRRPR